jgi:hypothetical protein
MNSKNALGFLVLGCFMHTTPLLAQSLADYSVAVADDSVRTLWMQFMSWVVGGIGLGYLTREGVVRVPVLLMAIVPERLLRPVEVSGEHEQMPSGVRVGISN